jgi:hypothetical protein
MHKKSFVTSRKETVMRALWRRYLAPLVLAAAALSAAPAVFASAPATHAGVALATPCPPGTNWDSRLQKCV